MKTPVGTEVDLGPGHIVLDGDPAPPEKGHSCSSLFESFRPMSIVATVATAELLFYIPRPIFGRTARGTSVSHLVQNEP